jgi:hypothetical protein
MKLSEVVVVGAGLGLVFLIANPMTVTHARGGAPTRTMVVQIVRRGSRKTIDDGTLLSESFTPEVPVWQIGQSDITPTELNGIQRVADQNRELYVFLVPAGQDIDAVKMQVADLINSDVLRDKVVNSEFGVPDGVYLIIGPQKADGSRDWRLRTDALERRLNVGPDQFFSDEGQPLKLAQAMIQAKHEGKGLDGMVQVLMDQIHEAETGYRQWLEFVHLVSQVAGIAAVSIVVAVLAARVNSTGRTYAESLADLKEIYSRLDELLKSSQESMESSEFDAIISGTKLLMPSGLSEVDLGVLTPTEREYAEVATLRVQEFLLIESAKAFSKDMGAYLGQGHRPVVDLLSTATETKIRKLISTDRRDIDRDGTGVGDLTIDQLIAFAEQGGAGISNAVSPTLPELLTLIAAVNKDASSREKLLKSKRASAPTDVGTSVTELDKLQAQHDALVAQAEDTLFSLPGLGVAFGEIQKILTEASQKLEVGDFVAAFDGAKQAADILKRVSTVIEVGESTYERDWANEESLAVVAARRAVIDAFSRASLSVPIKWVDDNAVEASRQLHEVAEILVTQDSAARLSEVKELLKQLTAEFYVAEDLADCLVRRIPERFAALSLKIDNEQSSLWTLLSDTVVKAELGTVLGSVVMLQEMGATPTDIAADAASRLSDLKSLLERGQVSAASSMNAGIEESFLQAEEILNATREQIVQFVASLQGGQKSRIALKSSISESHAPRLEQLRKGYKAKTIEGAFGKGVAVWSLQTVANSLIKEAPAREATAIEKFVNGEVLAASLILSVLNAQTESAIEDFSKLERVEQELTSRLDEATSLSATLSTQAKTLLDSSQMNWARSIGKSKLTLGSSEQSNAAALLVATENVDLIQIETHLRSSTEALQAADQHFAEDQRLFDAAVLAISNAASAVGSVDTAIASAKRAGASNLSNATEKQLLAKKQLGQAREYLKAQKYQNATTVANTAKGNADQSVSSANSAKRTAEYTYSGSSSSLSRSHSSGFSGGSIGGGGGGGFSGGSM